jgi:hypothetical protein
MYSLFGWLVADAGLFWETSTAGWLPVAGSYWEKSTAVWWLITRENRQDSKTAGWMDTLVVTAPITDSMNNNGSMYNSHEDDLFGTNAYK